MIASLGNGQATLLSQIVGWHMQMNRKNKLQKGSPENFDFWGTGYLLFLKFWSVSRLWQPYAWAKKAGHQKVDFWGTFFYTFFDLFPDANPIFEPNMQVTKMSTFWVSSFFRNFDLFLDGSLMSESKMAVPKTSTFWVPSFFHFGMMSEKFKIQPVYLALAGLQLVDFPLVWHYEVP